MGNECRELRKRRAIIQVGELPLDEPTAKSMNTLFNLIEHGDKRVFANDWPPEVNDLDKRIEMAFAKVQQMQA